jgi:hypothetical protein
MVVVDNPNNFKLVGFRKSKTKNKKYEAMLENKKTEKIKFIPFGDKRYEQYQDKTGLDVYSHKNHNDKKRRELYRKRHEGEDKNKFSSGYFAMKYLW